MNKDKMIADIIVFTIGVFIALFVVCITWFTEVEPRCIDLILRIGGSMQVFLLGVAYRDWQRRREDEGV